MIGRFRSGSSGSQCNDPAAGRGRVDIDGRQDQPVAGQTAVGQCDDWQEAGRSAAGPVHWPDWPAPFPPFVGGDGLASATAAEPTTSATANPMAISSMRSLVTSSPPFLETDPTRESLIAPGQSV